MEVNIYIVKNRIRIVDIFNIVDIKVFNSEPFIVTIISNIYEIDKRDMKKFS